MLIAILLALLLVALAPELVGFLLAAALILLAALALLGVSLALLSSVGWAEVLPAAAVLALFAGVMGIKAMRHRDADVKEGGPVFDEEAADRWPRVDAAKLASLRGLRRGRSAPPRHDAP